MNANQYAKELSGAVVSGASVYMAIVNNHGSQIAAIIGGLVAAITTGIVVLGVSVKVVADIEGVAKTVLEALTAHQAATTPPTVANTETVVMQAIK